MMRDLINDILTYLHSYKSVELTIDALKFYQKDFISISLISLPFFLPSALMDEYSYLLLDFSFNAFVVTYLPTIIDHLLYPIALGALITLFTSRINNYELSYFECIKSGIINWPKLFIATIIAEVLITVGFLLLIIPGIILVALLGFYDFFIVLENNGIILSIKNSANLSKNHLVEIIGSYLLLFAPIIWFHYLFYGPLSEIFGNNEFVSIVIDVFLSILNIVIIVLFFRLYCYFKNETHNNRLQTDAAQPRR